jgi:tight adherence protein C
MSAITLLAGLVLVGSVVTAVWFLFPQAEVATSGGTLERRLSSLDVADPMSPNFDPDQAELAKPVSERVIAPIIASIGGFMGRHTKDAQMQRLRLLIMQAGSRQKAESLLAQQIFLPVGGALGGFGLASLMGWTWPLNVMVPGAFVCLGYLYPTATLRSKVKKRAKEMRLDLPGMLDLLTISMEAGLSMDMALMRVCEGNGGALGLEFQKVLNEVRLGRPRMEALLSMAERNAVEELSVFIRAVVQAEPLGVSIANVLRIQSEELRRLRKQRAEEAGHRAPVLMLLPMMGCIFPCVFLILLGPAAVGIMTGPK